MSREQRRLDRKKSGSPPNRRTPVKAPGSGGGIPWTPLAIVGGFLLIGLLIVYLILQQGGDDDGLTPSEEAEQDSSPELAGTFVPSQGRGHFNFTFSLERTPLPFCEGVRWSGAPEGQPPLTTPGTTAVATSTPTTTPTPPAGTDTPAASGTQHGGTPSAPRIDCYGSNPPSSGQHLGVQRNVDVTGNGDLINIPADPDVYPDDIKIPREAIPHGLEHAGIYVGWNCADGDQACLDTVEDLKSLVNDRIDNHDDRVAMARDPDIPVGEIGVAGWTRFMLFPYDEYERDAVETFISDHACRFDPEGFCG